MKYKFLFFGFLFIFHISALFAQLKYAVIPESPTPGEPVTVAVSTVNPIRYAVLFSGGQRLARANFFNV
jgi:hypothetical protein